MVASWSFALHTFVCSARIAVVRARRPSLSLALQWAVGASRCSLSAYRASSTASWTSSDHHGDCWPREVFLWGVVSSAILFSSWARLVKA